MMSPEHVEHPYPTEAEKAALQRTTGLTPKQLTNWFTNNRKRCVIDWIRLDWIDA